MARVTLAIASSSTTRCGRLLSSAIARGTALGSMLSEPLLLEGDAEPGVATFAGACFIGDGASAFALSFTGDAAAVSPDGRAIESKSSCESPAITAAVASDFDCGCCCLNCSFVMPACFAACLGCG